MRVVKFGITNYYSNCTIIVYYFWISFNFIYRYSCKTTSDFKIYLAQLRSSYPIHYSNHYQIIILNPEFPIFIFNHFLQIHFERTVSNDCQLFTRWSSIVPILPSNSQTKKVVEIETVPFPFERLTKEKASFKFFVTNSRCIWIPTVVPSNLHLFAGTGYAEFPIPKLIFASSNFDTYQHSGCAVLLHELQRQG